MTKHKKQASRILSMLLTVAMVFGVMPMSVFADEIEVTESLITAFAPLDEDTVNQYWNVGTEESELDLPSTLTATIDDAVEEEIIVSVWQAEPEYDSETAGTYIFTPTLALPDNYILADSVELPCITVEVEAVEIEEDEIIDSYVITAFEPLDEPTETQYMNVGTDESELNLPSTLTATIDGTETENIAVSYWQSTPAYDPETEGTYVFTPILDLQDGYSVADDVVQPQITVEIIVPMGFAPMVGGGASATASATATIINTWIATADNGKPLADLTVTDTNATTVTVTGVEKIYASETLNLIISAGVTVDWQATLTNNKKNQVININTNSGANSVFQVSGSANLSSAYNSSTPSVIFNDSANTEVKVIGGTINGSTGTLVSTSYGINNNSSGTVTVSGGTINGGAGAGSNGIFNNSSGVATISGGTINGGTGTNTSNGISNNGTGTVSISGGTINGGSNVASLKSRGVFNFEDGTINVSGGTINGGSGVSSDGISNEGGGIVNLSGTVVISGGSGNSYGIYNSNSNKNLSGIIKIKDGANITISTSAIAISLPRAFEVDPAGTIITVIGGESSDDSETLTLYSTNDYKNSSGVIAKYAKITAAAESRTLYYNSENGKMYTARTGTNNANYAYSNEVSNTDIPGWSAAQVGGTGAYVLTLTDFSFTTTAQMALNLIYSTTIELVGTNSLTCEKNLATGEYEGLASENGRALTIQGDGSLAIKAGKTEGASYGIRAPGGLNIKGGTINVESSNGNHSMGLYLNGGDFILSGGTVSFKSGKSSASNSSYGIYAPANDIKIEGGTIIAQGNSSAFSKAPTITGDYEYWTNTDASDSGATKGTGTYTYDASNKYTKIAMSAAGTLNVTYAAGIGGTGAVTDSKSPYVDGAKVIVLDEGNMVNGTNLFAGWSDGTTTYYPGETFTINADITLTAQWVSDTTTTWRTTTLDLTDSATALSGGVSTEGWAWDSDTNTLTLRNAHIAAESGTGITLPGNSTIVLIGDNYVSGNSNYGIEANGSAIIKGAGSLIAIGGNMTGGGAGSYGIGLNSNSTLTIESGTVTAIGGSSTGYNGESIGIDAGANSDIIINGGTVTATGSTATISHGISAYGDIKINGGVVIARSGEATKSEAMNKASTGTLTTPVTGAIDEVYVVYAPTGTFKKPVTGKMIFSAGGSSSGNGYEWNSNTLTLNGACFDISDGGDAIRLPNGANIVLQGVNIVRNGTTSSNNSIQGIQGMGALTINGSGSLTAIGGNATDYSCFGISTSGTITVNGGKVTGIGGVTVRTGTGTGNSAGIDSTGLIVNGGKVTGIGGTATSTGSGDAVSAGIKSTGITITGGAVNAIGGTADTTSFGVNTGLYIDITGGRVTAAGADRGIFSNSAFTMSGGKAFLAGVDALRVVSNDAIMLTAPVGIISPATATIGTNTLKLGDADLSHAVLAAPNGTAPAITTASLSNGTVGSSYTQTLAATGTATITWSISSGSLPAGLSLNTSTGVISGTPTAAGTSNFTVKATNNAGNSTKALSITIAAGAIVPNPTPSNPTPSAPTPTAPPAVIIIVDGKEYNIGKTEVKGDTTTVTVNQAQLTKQIETAKDSVVIPVKNTNSNTVSAQLVVKNVDDITAKSMSLTVQVGKVSYEIPAAAVDTKAIMALLGASKTADVPISINITTTVDAKTKAQVDKAIKVSGGEIIVPAIQFTITATYEGKTVEVSTFDSYVARSIEITEEQAAKITTAVVIEPDGTTRHVPTRVYEKSGKWYAEINSRTNSTYTLIYNDLSFTDTDGKWYEKAVSEMAGRKIMVGTGEGKFEGDRNITRAEFAAIMVNALGLPAKGNASLFSDVSKSAWYYKAVGTAYEYGIINGRGNGIFDPNANITWQEAMIMVRNASKVVDYKGTSRSFASYPDASLVSDWAKDSVEFYVGSGMFVYDGKLRPTEHINRAETAVAVLGLLQKAGMVDVRSNVSYK